MQRPEKRIAAWIGTRTRVREVCPAVRARVHLVMSVTVTKRLLVQLCVGGERTERRTQVSARDGVVGDIGGIGGDGPLFL